MATIFINGLTVSCIIGTKSHERKNKQPLVFDIELTVDTEQAAVSDDIIHALDYESLSNDVIKFVETSNYKLIEALAENLANRIMQHYKPKTLKLTLSKPNAIDQAKCVGVVVSK